MSDEHRHQVQQQHHQQQQQQQQQRRRNCCRLCLAPDNECISILNSYAADKEPLATKIHTCVSVKISLNDNLSLRICHACISYLNSWQSFKNRCLSAQTKQRSWLDVTSSAASTLRKTIQSNEQHHTDDNYYDDLLQHQQQLQQQQQQQHHQQQLQHQQQQQQQDEQSLASSILEGISTLKKRKSLTVYVSPKSSQQQTNKQQQQVAVASSDVMPLKKRHYTKHKHATARRQLSQTPTSSSSTHIDTSSSSSKPKQKTETKKQMTLQQPLQQHLISTQQSFVIPAVPTNVTAAITTSCITTATTTTTTTITITTTATTTSCINTTSTSTVDTTMLTNTPIASCSSSSSSNIVPSTSTAAAAAVVATGSSGLAGDGCLIVGGASTASSSSAACSSAVQQLRLFRRYSYNPLPAVQIKDEPLELDEDYQGNKHHDESDEMVDPSMFLERNNDEGDFAESPSNYDYELKPLELKPLPASTTIRMSTKEAACRACNLKFSTRANARRHEKNLHPNLFETLEENDQSVNKQTAALNATLELQRAVAAAVAADACKLSSGAVITPQKYRQEVVNAFNNTELGYDYENPEKYQQLLTDEKIVFLQQNDEFLRQYQTMTCRCCNKFYTTYKNFMAHMRKKYLTLPRNCCFNCLKLNDSKALFISHLKRRNCINLHKVLQNLMSKNANFAAAVTATVAAAPEKMRAKELLVNKMYECKLCPKTFRLKLEFRSHVYEEHADIKRKDVSSSQCCYCALEYEDPAEFKRHYNNMECIVTLRCVTCDTKYDTHQKFMEHVQEKHLANFGELPKLISSVDNSPGKLSSSMICMGGGASSADESRSGHFNVSLINTTPKSQYFSRMPQACPICGQQYNNYNNVLRHMESKHPDQLPQTYKCVKCGLGYPRLSNLREHMVSAHGADQARHTGFEYIVNADAVKNAAGPTSQQAQNPYTGRYDYVMKDLMSITNGGTAADDDCDNESVSKKMRMDASVSLNNNNNNNFSSTTNQGTPRECPICNAVFANNIGLSNHMRSHQSAHNNSFGMAASRVMTASGGNSSQTPLSGQQQILKKSLEQAADRRFRRMRCRICQRRFSSKKSYRHHMLNDHQIRNVQFIKCKLCDAEFAYEKGLKVHMFKIHNTLLKDDMIIKQYECEICSIVYRTDVELQHHLANVHNKQGGDQLDDDDYNNDDSMAARGGADNSSVGADLSGISTPVSGVGLTAGDGQAAGPLYWYQCKYCPSNFNTNKKLAIHINSHDEFDSNDYSCKDCGNVYSGRKSLWVHRYKKHPQVPEPSECVMCKKMFFDTQMLTHHIPSCNRKPIVQSSLEAAAAIYKHKTGDDDDEDDDDQSRDAADSSITTTTTTLQKSQTGSKIKLPEVACTICGARFTDQDLFAKHIQMHEMELYTDNPLAAMFDTGPADPNQFYMDRMNDNGEYACDLCAKTFTQMTALKVHRKWHFRGDSKQNEADQHMSISSSNNNNSSSLLSQHHQQQQQHNNNNSKSLQQMPISHQHLLGLQAVGLMPRQFHKAQKRKRELKCQYCPSTFISNNNLRRHLYELHKNEMGNLPEPPKIECDVPNVCRRCNVKFETKAEWIEHKVADARVMKPFGPFQWGCDLCGAYVSRKEKLINHLHNHMKDQVIMPVEHTEAAAAANETLQTQVQNTVQQQQQQQQPLDERGDMPEFKKIKLPALPAKQMTPAQQQQREEEDEEEDEGEDSRDTTNNHYGEADEDDDEEEGEDNEPENDTVQPAAEEFDDEDEEDEPAEEEVFDDLAVGAQQTVGGDEDIEVEENEEDDDDDDDDEDDDDDNENDNEDDGDGDDEDPSTNEDTNEASSLKAKPSQIVQPRSSNDTEVDDDDDDDDSDEFDDDEEDNSSTENRKPSAAALIVKSRFSCDLCQLYFDTQQELQKHVKMHFLAGPGSVTLTEIKTSKSSSQKSRSSSSDVVAV